MISKVHTAESIQADKSGAIFGYLGEQESFQYQLTSSELWWLSWIGHRYEVTKYLEENTNSEGVLSVDYYAEELIDALKADGLDRLPCLDEETTLFQLAFYLTN
tara:strand:+ start:170 stop:481 length:312 start_codon:yes stop_codon:yes gene_type:complete